MSDHCFEFNHCNLLRPLMLQQVQVELGGTCNSWILTWERLFFSFLLFIPYIQDLRFLTRAHSWNSVDTQLLHVRTLLGCFCSRHDCSEVTPAAPWVCLIDGWTLCVKALGFSGFSLQMMTVLKLQWAAASDRCWCDCSGFLPARDACKPSATYTLGLRSFRFLPFFFPTEKLYLFYTRELTLTFTV